MTSYENLRSRLIPDTEAELRDFIERFRTKTMPGSYSAMERHFEIAKEKPYAFRNHGPVLAVSIGGSNTKVMIASMDDGFLTVQYARAQENPEEPTEFYDYLDSLLIRDETVRRYLETAPYPEIGVSIPMLLQNDCPIHPTKVPTLVGVIARRESEICKRLSFRSNFENYMRSRGLPSGFTLFYQSDGIVAHHGAVSMSEAKPEDKTVLCICGTGMANGDEKHYLPIALVCTLPEDDELFPPEETENRQLHYAVAGKGIYSLMRRTIETKVRLGGSALEGKNTERFFRGVRDTKQVFEIYRSHIEPSFSSNSLDEIKKIAGENGLLELQRLSELIVTRVGQTLSNAILATIVSMGAAPKGAKTVVYLEGSIARNPVLKPLLFRELHKKIDARRLSDFDGNPMRIDIVEDPALRELRPGGPDAVRMLSQVDTTLIGTATMVMAEGCIKG